MRIKWPSLVKLWSPFHPRMLCAKFGWNWAQWFWRRRFLNFVNVFLQFHYYLPLERAWSFIWTHFNCFHPTMLCVKFGWKWLSCSGKNYFSILSMDIFYLIIISPWKRRWPFIWKKFESPSPKDDLCHVWLKLAQWFWRRRLLNFVNVFSLFCNYLPMKKAWPFIWSNLNPLHPRMKLAQWFWRRWKCEKFLTDRQTNGQRTTARWSEKLTWAFRPGHRGSSRPICLLKIFDLSYTIVEERSFFL